MTKQPKPSGDNTVNGQTDHQHDYRLSHTEWETPSVQGGTVVIGSIEYAYLVCQCTSVIKRTIKPQLNIPVDPCAHNWFKCGPETDDETDDIKHCSQCGKHEK